jgi:hypothetical protein
VFTNDHFCCNGFSPCATEHTWRPLPSPLAPFLSRAAGEEGGGCPFTFTLAPFRSHAAGAEGWDEQNRDAPAAVHATAFTIRLTPLPQRGRGAGGEGGPQRGRGAGGEGYPLTLPLAPFRSHAAGAEGWDEQNRDAPAAVHATAFTIQLTLLPRCGRGVGGEGYPLTFPLSPFRSPTASGRGKTRDGRG